MGTEDDGATRNEQLVLVHMELVLEVNKDKNEDLEARSRRNNVRIFRVPESTAMSRIETYVEELM